MSPANLCFTTIIALSMVAYSNSWVFNSMNYSALERSNYLDEEDVDIEDFMAMQKFNLIFPGTKWCGTGNIADNYDDLGPSNQTDACCRDHDNCDDVILAGETKNNLTNTASYSRLSCGCDEKFRQCLRDVDSKTSGIVGRAYFNVIGTKCFRKDYQVTGCKRKGGWLHTKCVEYEYDETSEQAYQWFDVPNYK